MTRRKKQPTADAMREQLALAAEEIIRLQGLLHDLNVAHWMVQQERDRLERPWWRRLLGWLL